MVVAEQPHARFYRGLPPVLRHPWRRWLIVGAVIALAGSAIAVAVFALAYANHASPSGFEGGGGNPFGRVGPLFDQHALTQIGEGIAAALIIGGLLGFELARSWWSTLAIYVVGFVLWLWLGDIFAWFFWIFGVSAGAGLRGLIHRRRVLRASFVSQPG